MRYILNQNIALRSWRFLPYACYIRGSMDARSLEQREFEFLSKCDGVTEHKKDGEEKFLIEKFLLLDFIRPAGNWEILSDWQKPHFCNNWYVPVMDWMITGKCNYNCRHCMHASDNAEFMSEWTLEEAKKLLDEAQECGIHVINITGGEPLLHKYFFEIVEEIIRRNIEVWELNTNGQFISQTMLDWLKEIKCDPLMKISFDGLEHHDWMRNQDGAQEEALQAIRLCLKNGFRVKVKTSVNKQNISSLLSTAKLLEEMGVEEIYFMRTADSVRWTKNSGDAYMEQTEYYDYMLRFAAEYIKEEHTMPVHINQMFSLFPKEQTYRIHFEKCKESGSNVLISCRRVALAANGDVFSCLPISDCCKGETVRNVKTEGLQPVLQSETYLSKFLDAQTEQSQLLEERYYDRIKGLMEDWQKLPMDVRVF